MPVFTYKCDTCGRDEDRWFATIDERTAYEQSGAKPCKPATPAKGRIKCAGKLHRQPSAPNFKVNGYCAENGYQFNGSQTINNKGVV